MTNIPSAMRAWRFYYGLSLNVLAALTRIDQGRLRRIEHGLKAPSEVERSLIARALGGQASKLFPVKKDGE